MKKVFAECNPFAGFSLGVALYIAGVAILPAGVPTITAHRVDAPQNGVTYAPAAGDFVLNTQTGQYELANPVSYEGLWGAYDTDWVINELSYDLDPIVYNNTLLYNNALVAQAYVVNVTLPTTWSAPNSIRGSIDTSVIGPNSLVSAPLSGAIYSALIDGNVVETLQDDPFALGTSQSATSSSAQFGYDLSNIAVNNSIGIRLTFTLSPGAYVAIISDFEVVDVIPEPSTFALLGLGFMTLVMARRRA